MHKSRLPLYGIEETIDRPVIIILANDIKKMLDITIDVKLNIDEDEPIDRFKNKLGQIEDYSSPRNEFIEVEYEENISEGEDISLLINKPESYPFYNDTEINSSIRPILHKREIVITFRYFNKSKSKVNAIINKLRLLPANDGVYNTHDLEYSYVLPTYVTRLLDNINTLKNNRLADVDKKTLAEYINSTIDDRVDVVNSIDGNVYKSDITVREAQLSVLGYIVTELGNIKKQSDKDRTSWFVEFEYSITYEKAVELLLYHPIMIYNQLLDKLFRKTNNVKPLNRDAMRLQASEGIYRKTGIRFDIPRSDYYLKIPKSDTITLPKPQPFTARILHTLIILDVADTTALFNLNDIPGIKFKDNVYDFIVSERDYINNSYKTLFSFELYEQDKKVFNNPILLDANGNLTTTIALDIKKVYRVSINVLTDYNLLRTADNKRIVHKFYLDVQSVGLVRKVIARMINIFKDQDIHLLTNNNEDLVKLLLYIKEAINSNDVHLKDYFNNKLALMQVSDIDTITTVQAKMVASSLLNDVRSIENNSPLIISMFNLLTVDKDYGKIAQMDYDNPNERIIGDIAYGIKNEEWVKFYTQEYVITIADVMDEK